MVFLWCFPFNPLKPFAALRLPAGCWRTPCTSSLATCGGCRPPRFLLGEKDGKSIRIHEDSKGGPHGTSHILPYFRHVPIFYLASGGKDADNTPFSDFVHGELGEGRPFWSWQAADNLSRRPSKECDSATTFLTNTLSVKYWLQQSSLMLDSRFWMVFLEKRFFVRICLLYWIWMHYECIMNALWMHSALLTCVWQSCFS